jgi:RNA polymerase subunit RPABC4/transcription elongation factor Spt4
MTFLIGWPGGSLEATLRLAATLLIAYVLVLWLSAVIWVYRDITNRTRDTASQVIAVLLVAVFNLPGLIIYLVIRPQVTLADAYERSLEAEAVLHELQITASACQTCRRPIEDDFNVCPHCRTILREPCRSCSRLVRTSWITCPYCAVDRVQPRPQPAAARQAAADAGSEPLQRPPRRAEQRDMIEAAGRRTENGGAAQPQRQAAPRER